MKAFLPSRFAVVPVIGCLLLLGLLTLTGCKAGPAATGPHLLIDPIEARDLGYGIAWATSLGTRNADQVSEVAVLGDMIVTVERPSNLVTAVALRDGSMLWRRRFATATERLFEPLRWDNRILINSERHLYLLSVDDGRVIQRQRLEAVVDHRPALVGDLALFGGLNGRIYGHDLNTGYTRWAYQMPGGIVARPVAYRGQVFVADTTGHGAMLNASDGSLTWRTRMFDQVTTPAAIGSQGIYVASHDQNLYALDRNTGRDRSGRWPYRSTQPLTASPILMGSTVYLSVPRVGLTAIHASTGEQLWQLPYHATPITQQDQRLILLLGGRIQYVDLNTGAAVRQVDVTPLKTIVPLDNGSLLLVTDRGRIVRLTPQR